MAKVTRKVKVNRGAGEVERAEGPGPWCSKGDLEGIGDGGVLEVTWSQQPALGLDKSVIHFWMLLPGQGR